MAELDLEGLRAQALACAKPADYARVARELRGAGLPGATPVRVALLASHSLQFVDQFLVVEGYKRSLGLGTYFGAFGQFEQELADPAGALYQFDPQVVVLSLRPEDVDPDCATRYFQQGGGRARATLADCIDRLEACVRLVRARSSATVLVANFAPPAHLPLGPFDAGLPGGFTHELARANAALAERLTKLPGAVIWDYAGLVQSAGAATWTDRRLWVLGRIAVAAPQQPVLAAHLARAIAGVIRKPAKCLVLDLDNTIWGGVIGDDGMAGIHLGDDYPGSVFKSFQRAVLGLYDRGILLAVVSKNEHAVAEQVFREHPEMLIRWEHIAAARINWGPKSANLRAIAQDLNIGSDALVFFDDNPVERAEVRAGAPEVTVIEVPTDPIGYERVLYESGVFDQTGVSEEDLARTGMYRSDKARQELAASHENVEDFLRSLAMEADIGTADDLTLGRITQLVGKTNQFNLTTRRYSQVEMAARAADPSQLVAWLRLRDRFGDQGLVCVAIVVAEGDSARIDSFLMSCRVMNRKVEHTLMALIAGWARAKGCARLVGDYIPTAKNGMVSEFYPGLGFETAGALEGKGTRYTLDLATGIAAFPNVIAVSGSLLPAESGAR